MLGISEEHIIEHVEEPREFPEYDRDEAVRFRYNRTEPQLLRDGVDGVAVIEERDDQYLVEYWGYISGYYRVTREGVEDLGAAFLGEGEAVPHWLVEPADPADLPWWIPDEYEGEPTFTCQHCESETPARNILTPTSEDPSIPERLCRNCWDEIRSP